MRGLKCTVISGLGHMVRRTRPNWSDLFRAITGISTVVVILKFAGAVDLVIFDKY